MYHGDIRLADTIDIKFCTVNTSGVPTTLAGTPVVSAYVGNGLTEITAGVTLTVDFDARTGLHNVRVVATGANGFATATNVQLVITTGTVGGSSVVGYVVGSFSIEARSALMPTTVGRTLVVDAAGLADANAVKVGPTGAGTAQTAADIPARLPAALVSGRMDSSVGAYAAGLTPMRPAASGTADSGTTTTVVDAERTEADTDYWAGCLIKFTSGTLTGQTRLVTAFNAATDTLTFAPALTVAAGTHTYDLYAHGRVDVHEVVGGVINALIAGRMDANAQVVGDKTGYTANPAAGGITTASFGVGAIDNAAFNVTETLTANPATGGIVAASFGVGAIDNAAFNVTETLTANPAAGGITTASFGAGAIDNAAFNVTKTLTANPATGGIVALSFAAGAIDAAAIAANAIGASELAADAVTEIADGLLDRDLATGTDSGSATVRTVRQALRFLRNKWSITAGTMTVTKENDATASWTGAVTTTSGDPVTAIDPAGP